MNRNPHIILASTSPFRKALLERLHMEFEVQAPKIDEETFKDSSLTPQNLCEKLALKKAQSLLTDHPQSVIIGSDQLIDFNGQVLGKAGSPESAADQLVQLSGQTHALITSMVILYAGQVYQHTDITQMTMRHLTRKQALAYVMLDETWHCAGSYKFEKAGIGLFEKVESKDYTAIIGLPLIALTSILYDIGCFPPFMQP